MSFKTFSNFLLAAAVCAQSANGQTTVGDAISINPEVQMFTDTAGRVINLHGVNVLYKVDPYLPSTEEFNPETSLNDEDIANLVKWGMNFVRLSVMWEAVERTEGVYDDEYLDNVEKLINSLGKSGIYTLVDMHQDAFARLSCGEGFPDFYAKQAAEKPYCINRLVDALLKPLYEKLGFCQDMSDYGYEKDSDGNPLIDDCRKRPFWMYYLTKESIDGFEALYKNKFGLKDKFIAYWDKVSSRFANNPYVVGYDPLNEPFFGNPFGHPLDAIPGYFDRNGLAPLYSDIEKVYEKNDPTSKMWFEPVQETDVLGVLGGLVFNVGFESPPGAEIGSARHVLNDHVYCCQLTSDMCTATGEPGPQYEKQCEEFHQKKIGTRAKDAAQLGVPLMITEFGACLTEGPCTAEITQVTSITD